MLRNTCSFCFWANFVEHQPNILIDVRKVLVESFLQLNIKELCQYSFDFTLRYFSMTMKVLFVYYPFLSEKIYEGGLGFTLKFRGGSLHKF
jgi:hypothetical protein